MISNLDKKHATKQVDRLLSNKKLDIWEESKAWVPFIIGARNEIMISMDWTDFYHLCEYLAEAAKSILTNGHAWVEQQKLLLKNSQVTDVLMALKPYIEPSNVPDEHAPVRACYRYIENRDGQFLYKEALEKNLPIGSGEVESEHRYISQKRLKLAGAWWKDINAANMLSLRVLRANNHWKNYWENTRLKTVA